MQAQKWNPAKSVAQAFAYPSCLLVILLFVGPEKMKSKLLRDSETDVAAPRHEHRARGMSNVPIHSYPNVRTRTKSRVCGDSRKQHIATASVLCGSRDPVVLRVQPGERGADEPFPSYVLRFVGPIGKPEARFDGSAEPSPLSSL